MDLWLPEGDCLVYFLAKGERNPEPSFKISYSRLLKSKCFPLINQLLVTRKCSGKQLRHASQKHEVSRPAELHIRVPPTHLTGSKSDLHFRLEIRNLLAWVFQRPVVGDSLGSALIGLMYSMQQCRDADEDGIHDLRRYLKSQGYSNLANNPDHALALLRLSETFKMRQEYVRAFAHSVGMSDRLFRSPDYEVFVAIDAFL